MKILCCLLLAGGAAFGQLQFYSYVGAKEVAITGSYSVGSTGVGSTLDLVIRVRNAGTLAITIPRVTLSGQGFKIVGTPTLPLTLAPGDPMDIKVQYAPTTMATYSANLGVNSSSIVLVGTASAAAPTISITQNGVRQDIPQGSVIDFGRVQYGANRTLTIAIENRSASVMTIGSMTLQGPAVFSLVRGSLFPLTLNPTELSTFDLQFAPTASLVYAGTITLDNRTISLTGTGFDPPFAPLTIVVEPSLVSGIQSSLSITTAQPAPITVSGTLTLAFQAASGADDAAIRFMAAGGRVLTFTFNQGDTIATIGTAKSALFQTGTAAGTFTFFAVLPTVTAQAVSKIQPQAIKVDSTISNRPNDFTLRVQVAGFDNSRSATEMAFTFYDATGAAVPPGRIAYNAATDFSQFFGRSTAGGLFSLLANFPVSGSAGKVAGVDVELTNSAGTTKLSRLLFQPCVPVVCPTSTGCPCT